MLYRIYRNQFWILTSLETFSVGILALVMDYFHTGDIPPLFAAFNPPYMPWLMIIIGIYSLIMSTKKVNAVIVVGNAFIWGFIAFTSIFEAVFGHSNFVVIPGMLAVVSIIILLRIIFNAIKIELESKVVSS